MDRHKAHHTSAPERAHSQAGLSARRVLLLQSLQHKETDLQRLQKEAQDISRSAQRALQHSGDSFRDLALLLEQRRSEVENWIRSQEQIQLSRLQRLQNQLQEDVTAMKRSLSELDALALTQDRDQCRPPLATDTQHTESRIQTGPRRDFEDVSRAVSALRDKLQLILGKVIVEDPEPSSREDFLRYACDITLDPDTADPHVSLSDGNTRATFVFEKQRSPDHPDRFSVYQVLSREALTGRCYWELEWDGMVLIAAAMETLRETVSLEIMGNPGPWTVRAKVTHFGATKSGLRSQVRPVQKNRGLPGPQCRGTVLLQCSG
ncbi:hypothetical protein NQD34_012417 [Periophthalmus magnuspinnatus]|nr:hypothetical protein NQD34_012417 [Periophthalmus magnuspinnatus]